MYFSQTELKTLAELGNGKKTPSELAEALSKSISQIYRTLQKLEEKDIITLIRGTIKLKTKTHITLLTTQLASHKSLITPLSGAGMRIYTELSRPQTLQELVANTKLHQVTILKKIQEGKKISLVKKENKRYSLNEKLWPEAKQMLDEMKIHEKYTDERIPANSRIYKKENQTIIFSNKDELDATKTAFSRFSEYEIKILLLTNYYILPKQELTTRDIFNHALIITEEEFEIRKVIFITLFYLKYKEKVSNIDHPILKNIKGILKGETIKGYPTRQELEEKAKVYNLKL
ncbi:MAG: helix-turn-helix domain-containing protein [Nanobdellota archaeon]